MTADELVREVRRKFILDDRAERFWRRVHPSYRAEYAAAGRKGRARRRELLRSQAYRNVAQGYVAAGDYYADGLVEIVTWLPCLSIIVGTANSSPHSWVQRVQEQERMHLEHVRKLRDIAGTLVSGYRDRLNQLALEIERDGKFALFGADIGLPIIGDPSNLGARGAAASRPSGAWRGWLVRELKQKLPHFEVTPDRFATITKLLTWAGVKDLTPNLVRAILLKGTT